MRSAIITLGVALAITSVANANIYVDTFEGSNPTGWEWAAAGTTLQATGGNPGGMLEGVGWGFNYPVLRTATSAASPFHGDYRAVGVTDISFDLTTYDAPAWTMDGQNDFTGTLVLHSGSMAAAAPIGAYMFNSHAGWHNISVAVPAASATLPAGWMDYYGGLDWNALITNVDQVEIVYFDGFGTGINYDVAVDNVALVPEPTTLSLMALSVLGLIRRR